MNMKQVWGVAGGFFAAYMLITLTNKPAVEPAAPGRGAAEHGRAGEAPQARSAFQPGYCFPGFGPGAFDDSRAEIALASLAGSGARWVALTPLMLQASGSANEIETTSPETPSLEATAKAIRASHRLGLQVMLRPVVSSRDGTRREDFTPLDPTTWFASYQQAMGAYLDLAAREGVAIVCLGSSYSRLEARQPWPALIADARTRYSGQLTYGAAMAGEGYQRVAFWEGLDFVGIDAVMSENERDPERWRRAGEAIDAWQRQGGGGKPVLFTSLGFPADTGGATFGEGDRQSAAYRAFLAGMDGFAWLAGSYGYYWDNPASSLGRTAYGLTNTPAAKVLAAYYAQR